MEKKVLVAVFSASGVTKRVGEKIAEISGGDFFEIVPEEKYTSADLNYMNSKSRSSLEMKDPSARPSSRSARQAEAASAAATQRSTRTPPAM